MFVREQTILPQCLSKLHVDLLRVQNYFLRGASDLDVDLHQAHVLPRATKLQVEEGNMVVDGLRSAAVC